MTAPPPPIDKDTPMPPLLLAPRRRLPALTAAGVAGLLLAPALVAAPAAASTADTAAPAYTVVDLGPLAGGTASFALGVASDGTAVGTSRTGTGSRPQVAVRWRDGVVENLGTLPGSTFSRAFAVNSSGQAVGEAFTPAPNEQSRAVLWEADGTLRDLGTLGGASAVANDIDERGRAFGISSRTSGPSVATVWGADGPQALPHPDPTVSGVSRVNAVAKQGLAVGSSPGRVSSGTSSQATRWNPRGQGFVATALDRLETDRFSVAYGVSENGVVVGEATRTVPGSTSTVTRATRWDGTAVSELPGLRSYRFTRANDVSNRGEAVGFASGFAGFPSIDGAAVLWWGGEAHDLNELVVDGGGFVLRTAESVNEAGQIVGFGSRNGQTHAYRLDPVRR